MRNRILTVTGLLAAAVMMAFPAAAGEDGNMCGFILGSFDRIPDVLLAEGIEEQADQLNIPVSITDHGLDARTAEEKIQSLQKAGCRAIAIACTDSAGMKAAIEKAAQDGIAMFAFDTTLDSQEISCVIGLDDREGGRLGGSELLRLTQEGDEVAIIGFPSIPSGKEREEGAMEVLKNSDRIVLTGYNYEGKTDRARKVMDNILSEHPDVKAVFCVADLAASGAYEAVREHGSACKIIGFNGNQEAWETMRSAQNEDCWVSEIAQDRHEIGAVLVTQMKKKLEEGSVDAKRIKIAPYILTFSD